ncbi:hypothetical protein [Streptomyces sp. NPDC002054]|uniref:hypothetical protein n=1 Tax=Streptomyces sp. NPDC002054 TaxID=3154663 RepID=UPI003332809B
MATGSHGVRMQYGYRHDIAGSGRGVTDGAPRWLRLTRSGDTVTGHESADGRRWTEVGAVRLPGLPETVQVGLFATSPGDLTLRRTGLGGATEQVRWTQAGGTFDSIALRGATAGGWSDDAVGERNRTDWEKDHLASGAVEKNGTITVTGAGDIGPAGAEDGARPVERTLGGLALALLIVLAVSVRFAATGHRAGPADGTPVTRSRLAAKAIVIAAVTFATALLAIGIVIPAGMTILKGNGIPVIGVSALTGTRVVVGTAGALALAAAGPRARLPAAALLARDPRRRPDDRGSVRRDLPSAAGRRPVKVAAARHSGRRLRRPADPRRISAGRRPLRPLGRILPASVVGRDRCAVRVHGHAPGACAEASPQPCPVTRLGARPVEDSG